MGLASFQNKIYCCSNTSKSEAKKLAVIDIIVSFIAVIFCSWATHLIKNRSTEFRSLAENENETLASDFQFILGFENYEQDFFFAGLLLWCIWGMAMGTLLFVAAGKEKQGLLKLHFGATLLEMTLTLIVVVLAFMYLHRKFVIVAITAIVYIYKSYELWIVYSLTKTLRSGSTVFASEDDDQSKPAFTVESPAPDAPAPEPVFTVEANTPTPTVPPTSS